MGGAFSEWVCPVVHLGRDQDCRCPDPSSRDAAMCGDGVSSVHHSSGSSSSRGGAFVGVASDGLTWLYTFAQV